MWLNFLTSRVNWVPDNVPCAEIEFIIQKLNISGKKRLYHTKTNYIKKLTIAYKN